MSIILCGLKPNLFSFNNQINLAVTESVVANKVIDVKINYDLSRY